MPQMDIMLSPNPEEEPFVTIGWDEGDAMFLWLYVREDKKWNQVKLQSENVKKLWGFLNSRYGSTTMTKQDEYICPEAKELADRAKTLSEWQLARAIQDLINTAAEQTAGNMFRGTPPADELVRAFAKAVLHGDDEHKAWLLEAAEAFINGKPLSAPRGKGT